jgi:hypothetical protein
MCTWIVEKARMVGSGKGPLGWMPLTGVNVSYDHPYYSTMEHAVLIDFVNESKGPAARVAIELTEDSARDLIKAITAALQPGALEHA